jgi:hypothetical protein
LTENWPEEDLLSTINVNLPDGMKALLDAQVAAGGYAGPSDTSRH